MGLWARLNQQKDEREQRDGRRYRIGARAAIARTQRKPIHPIRHVASRVPPGGSGPSEKAILRAWRAGKLQVEPPDPELVEQFNRALENALPPQPGLDSEQGRLF